MKDLIATTQELTMSSREISELVEARHDNVKRTIERLATPKLNADGSVKKHAVITVTPMEEPTKGGGKPWQELEQQQQKKQTLPEVKDPQLAAMVTMLTQLDTVKQEQESQRNELANLRAKITSSPQDYYTVSGYASLRGINLDVKEAKRLGRMASKLSREQELETGTAHSEIFGRVNTYHVDILCQVFDDK